MSNQSSTTINLNVNAETAATQIHTGTGDQDQTIGKTEGLEKKLTEILAETEGDKAGFQDLRGEVRKMQGEMEDTGEVPKSLVQRLKPYIALVEPTGKVVKIIESIIKLLGDDL